MIGEHMPGTSSPGCGDRVWGAEAPSTDSDSLAQRPIRVGGRTTQ